MNKIEDKNTIQKQIECEKIISRPKNLSEMEIILAGCKTTPTRLADMLNEYNRKIQKEKGPALLDDVNVDKMYNSKTIFGCNHEYSANLNRNGIYFMASVTPNKVVFEFLRKNQTQAWLDGFCKQYVKTKN